MRRAVLSKVFKKSIKRLKGQEAENLHAKIVELCACNDIDHYKNLKGPLKRYKRVHVNKAFVVLFFGDDGTVYFVDYAHHDEVYDVTPDVLRRYESLFPDG